MGHKRELIQYFITRCNDILSIGKWDKFVEDAYYQVKESICKTERLWELESPRFYWSQQLKDDLYRLHIVLEKVWRLKFKE